MQDDEAASPPEQTRAVGSTTRLLTLTLTSLLIAGAAVWLMHAGALPILPPAEAWREVDFVVVAAYAVLWSSLLVVRSWRWVFLLRPQGEVSTLRPTLVGLVGLGALIVFPMRLGEAVRPLLIRRYEPVSGWTATGVVAAERIVDGLVLSGSLLIAIGLAERVREVQTLAGFEVSSAFILRTVWIVFAVFSIGLLGSVLAYWQRDLAARILGTVLAPIPRLARTAPAILERLLAGFSFLPRRSAFVAFVGTTIFYWGANGFGLWWLAHGCQLDLSIAQAFVVLGILALGVLVPNAPGLFGLFQLSTYVGLVLFTTDDVLAERGAAFVVLLYAVQVGGTLLAALVGWIGLRLVAPPRPPATP